MRFNESLKQWHETYGCTANFSWKYTPTGEKVLTVSEIDLAVYRTQAPRGEVIEDLIARYGKD